MPPDPVSRREVLALGAALIASEESARAASATPSGATAAPAVAPPIDRGFVRLTEGLVHYRFAGDANPSRELPLYLAHAGPGSSRAFESIMPSLARKRRCIAPDMLGNGDSAPPANDRVAIGYYAESALRVMDALKIERVDFFGSHTGAQIGCELALAHPDRVRRLIMDGMPVFPPAFKTELIAHYAPHVEPDDFGGQLAWAWNFVRDQSLYWPYFDRRSVTRLANPVPSAAALHAGATDVIKALATYHIAYRAAFEHDTQASLPRLRCPVLLMATASDPLSEYLEDAGRLLPNARRVLLPRGTTPDERVALLEDFLTG